MPGMRRRREPPRDQELRASWRRLRESRLQLERLGVDALLKRSQEHLAKNWQVLVVFPRVFGLIYTADEDKAADGHAPPLPPHKETRAGVHNCVSVCATFVMKSCVNFDVLFIASVAFIVSDA